MPLYMVYWTSDCFLPMQLPDQISVNGNENLSNAEFGIV